MAAASGSLRRRVYQQLEPGARQVRGLSPVNRALALLIVAAAMVAIVETEPTISGGRERLFRIAEVSFALIFAAEYAARIWTAVENPRFAARSLPRLRYALTFSALIDLLAIVPALLAYGGGGSLVLRSMRVLRMIRLAQLGRMSAAWQLVAEAVRSRRFELGITAGMAAVALLVSAALLYWAEGEAQPEQFGSIPRALWWATATLTTVGYGDVYPVTALGKVLAGLVAITGVALIALPAGILAAAFSDALQRQRHEQ